MESVSRPISPTFSANVTDALFIGPNDLASSLGYVAFDHASTPEVQEATAKVLKAANDAGKYAGHFAMSAEAGTSPATRSQSSADTS